MIDASQRMLDVQSKVQGEAKEGWSINPVMKKHLELEIKTLQNAPRDAICEGVEKGSRDGAKAIFGIFIIRHGENTEA